MLIEQLFQPGGARRYFNEKMPTLSHQYDLSDLQINFIKRNLDAAVNYYHVILRFDAEGFGDLAVFMTAHSQEDRASAYQALLFLDQRFPRGNDLFLARPLLYDKDLNAFFYLGLRGGRLLELIGTASPDLPAVLSELARWLARLHGIVAGAEANFNAVNSRIATVVPGPDYFLEKIGRLFPQYRDRIKVLFFKLTEAEEKSLSNLDRLYLIHGDLHPENVIINAPAGLLTVIDYTDACLSDWARDLGNFIYQFDFMSRGYLDKGRVTRLSNLFLKEYFAAAGIKDDASAKRRLNLYQSWAALRATIYFLVKVMPEEKNARQTLADARYWANLL